MRPPVDGDNAAVISPSNVPPFSCGRISKTGGYVPLPVSGRPLQVIHAERSPVAFGCE
jgi:hypothetical protein